MVGTLTSAFVGAFTSLLENSIGLKAAANAVVSASESRLIPLFQSLAKIQTERHAEREALLAIYCAALCPLEMKSTAYAHRDMTERASLCARHLSILLLDAVMNALDLT